MSHDKNAQKPKTWGLIAAVFWAMAAFLVPQFVLYPFIGIIQMIPTDANAKTFIFQGLSELGTISILWLVLRKLYHSHFRDIGLGEFNPSLLSWSVLAFPVYLVGSLVAINIAQSVFGIDVSEVQDIGYSSPDGLVMVFVFVGLVLLAPFAEELLFRGFLFNAVRQMFGFWVSAGVVSLLFAVAHQQLNVGIDVFVLSMVLCYLREKTHSLWPSIGLHVLKNFVAFMFLFVLPF